MYVRLKSLWHNESLIFLPFSHMAKKEKSRFFSKAASPQGAKTGEELELVFPSFIFSLLQCGKKKCESIIFLSQKGPSFAGKL